MAITYHLDTLLTDGKYKGKTVAAVLAKHPDFVFKTIKKWAANKVHNKEFDDEVLAAAHITKTIRYRDNDDEGRIEL